MKDDLVLVDEFVSGIRWDAKYATWDNFTGKPVDGYVENRIGGTKALCAALERACGEAATLGFGLLLWDGYRPQRAVDCFLRWSKQPEDGRTKLRHYPNIDKAEMFERGYVAAKSGHSRGSAVDLTLYQLDTGELTPMGGGHDLMDSISHHGAKGITQVEARNRHYLCSIMAACGFSSYDREWWHYTLKGEPYPDTYFDFPIAWLSRSASPGEARRRHRHGALGKAGGAVPEPVTVFDDEVPAVANLDRGLLGALRRAATDAADDGVEIFVNGGWRSPEYQEQLLREAVSKYGSEEEAARWVATAETSAHVSGHAVDIGPSDATAWLSKHGAKYGLCQIYGNEPWHYELRPEAINHGCPPMYADPTHDPRMHQRPARSAANRDQHNHHPRKNGSREFPDL